MCGSTLQLSTLQQSDPGADTFQQSSNGFNPSIDKVVAESADAEDGDPGLRAIKRIAVPSRKMLSSEQHERMHKVWDAVQSVSDGYGRPRARSFMKLPQRSENPQYFGQIEKPIHLEIVRKKINALKYV